MNPTFFGLNSSIKNEILDEHSTSMEVLNISYTEVLKMPVYIRRYFLGLKVKEYEKKQAQIENVTKKGGKTSFSGDALKSKLENNEIPLQ